MTPHSKAFFDFNNTVWAGDTSYPEDLPGRRIKRQWISDRRWGYDALDVWQFPTSDGPQYAGVEVLVLAGDEGDTVVRDVYPVESLMGCDWRRRDD